MAKLPSRAAHATRLQTRRVSVARPRIRSYTRHESSMVLSALACVLATMLVYLIAIQLGLDDGRDPPIAASLASIGAVP